MLKKVLGYFGFVPAAELKKEKDNFLKLTGELQDVLKGNKVISERLADAKNEVFELKRKELNRMPIPVVGVSAVDPSPEEGEARKLYVARAAGLHTDILKLKIESMVADVRSQFEQLGRETFGLKPEQYDSILKGTINGLWLVYQWGEMMVGEQISNQTEKPLTDAEKAELKSKL